MIKLNITGMSCGHCVRTVNEALVEVAGVDKVVEISLERGEAEIEGNADVNALIAAIEEEGYAAQAA